MRRFVGNMSYDVNQKYLAINTDYAKKSTASYLMSIQSDRSQCQCRDMQWAILDKPTDVTHTLSKHPGTVHKTNLKKWKKKTLIYII